MSQFRSGSYFKLTIILHLIWLLWRYFGHSLTKVTSKGCLIGIKLTPWVDLTHTRFASGYSIFFENIYRLNGMFLFSKLVERLTYNSQGNTHFSEEIFSLGDSPHSGSDQLGVSVHVVSYRIRLDGFIDLASVTSYEFICVSVKRIYMFNPWQFILILFLR